MAHDWHWQLYDAASTTAAIAELTQAHDRRVTWRLGEPADATFTLDGRHELAHLVDELTVDLRIRRDDETVFHGRLGASSDDVDTDDHVASFTGVDYTGLLGRRALTTPQAPWTFTGIAQGSIVRQLIAWTQGTTGGQLGIAATSGTVPDTATTRIITFTPGKWIGEAIDELAQLENGFDWWIDHDLVARLASPVRGAERDLAIEYGSSAVKVTRAFDPASYANALMVTGEDGQVPRYATAADIATRPEGRFDALESFPDIASSTVLQSRANAALATRALVTPAYAATLAPDRWRPRDLWVGDTTWLVVRSGRLDVRKIERVSQIDATIDDDGTETIAVTLGVIPSTLAKRLRSTTRRLIRLERLGAA